MYSPIAFKYIFVIFLPGHEMQLGNLLLMSVEDTGIYSFWTYFLPEST